MEQYNAKSLEMCDCNNCDVDKMGIDCIAQRMLATEAGQKLVNMQRWSRFAWEDKQRFEEFFGPDINNFWHGPHQAKTIAIPFIETQNTLSPFKISEEDGRLLVIANCVHDLQEAFTGDIPLPEKTDAGNAHELILQRGLVAEALGVSVYHPMINKIQEVQKGDGFLSQAFKAIEYAGYFETALRAWSAVDNSALSQDEREKCYALGQAVLTKNMPAMHEMSATFPYIEWIIESNAYAIDEANN